MCSDVQYQVALELPNLLESVIDIGFPVVRPDGRWSVYGNMITKFCGMGRFISYGAPQTHASRARGAVL